MSEDLKSDHVFREKLEGFSDDPPGYIWNNIQSQLASAKRRRKVILMTWISSAAVLLFAALGGWYFSNQKSDFSTQIENIQRIKPIEDNGNFIKNTNPEFVAKTENRRENINSNVKLYLSESNTQVKKKDSETNNNENHRIGIIITETIAKRSARIYLNERNEKLAIYIPKLTRNSLTEQEVELIAQNLRESNTKEAGDKGLKMGLYVSPGYSSHTASHSANYRNSMNNKPSDGNANVGGGFSFIYKIKKRWGLESGVYYAQNGQKSNNSNSIFSIQKEYDFADALPLASGSNKVNLVSNTMVLNNLAGKIIMNEPPRGTEFQAELDNKYAAVANNVSMTGEFTQVFDFVEIPLYARFDLVDSDLNIQLLGGISAGIVAGNKAFVTNGYGLQKIGKTEDISNLNISGTFGFGINYELTKNLSVAVEPRINYFFNSLNRSGEVNYRPYRIGIYSGLNYEF